MLTGFGYSFPFIVLRIICVLIEGLILILGTKYVHDFFMFFMSGYVPSLFLTFLNPMGYIIGLAISAIIVKYPMRLIQYYFKLSHIVYLTIIINNIQQYRKTAYLSSFSQAASNFTSLALNDLTTRSIVKVLKALKTAILNNDFMSRFTEPKTSLVRLIKSLCSTALGNVINMTDEMVVSYTWLTYDMYLFNCKQKKKEPSIKQQLKVRASYMLESLVFIVRVFPKLLISSIFIEVGFLILSNIIASIIIFLVVTFSGFSLWIIFFCIVLYRTCIQVIYYTLIESLRLTFYLYSFYSELSELEPLNIRDGIADLLGKVPLLKSLVKKSGKKIEPTGSEGTPILEGDINSILVDNVKEVAKAFNLNPEDIIENKKENKHEVQEEKDVELEEVKEETEQEQEEDEKVPDVSDIDLGDDVEVDLNLDDIPEPTSPFNNSNRITHDRGGN